MQVNLIKWSGETISRRFIIYEISQQFCFVYCPEDDCKDKNVGKFHINNTSSDISILYILLHQLVETHEN